MVSDILANSKMEAKQLNFFVQNIKMFKIKNEPPKDKYNL